MKQCKKCNVTVADPKKSCPLCGADLIDGDKTERETFPSIPLRYKRHSLYFRLLILGTVAAGIISVMINLLLPKSGWWSLIVLLAILCFWLLLGTAIKKTSNIAKNILWQSALTSLLLIFWDLFSGWHRWSVDYAIPAIYIAAMLGIAVVSQAMRLRGEDYIIYLLIDTLLGLIPLAFFLTGLADVGWLCVVSVMISLLTLTSLFLFSDINLFQELKKRLHF